MKKGILIIAVGHKHYLAMAQNLAASIKCNEPNLQIALATDKPPSAELLKNKLVDSIVHVPANYITHHGKECFIKSKLYMYDLSPFEETIFLDADQIMLPNKHLTPIFESLKDVDFTISNTGLAEVSIWADIKEVKSIYGDKPYYNYHSEFVYFKKGKAVKAYFKTALKVFNDNKVKSATVFGGAVMADELAFQIASMITGLFPHLDKWCPNFWFSRDEAKARLYPYQLIDFVTYSIGGNTIPSFVKNCYNNMAKSYFAKLLLSNPFQVVDKRTYLPERQSI